MSSNNINKKIASQGWIDNKPIGSEKYIAIYNLYQRITIIIHKVSFQSAYIQLPPDFIESKIYYGMLYERFIEDDDVCLVYTIYADGTYTATIIRNKDSHMIIKIDKEMIVNILDTLKKYDDEKFIELKTMTEEYCYKSNILSVNDTPKPLLGRIYATTLTSIDEININMANKY
jgi:hypothetical protein